MADKKILLTQDGYNKLVEKLDYMKSVRRIEISERLKAAIALGDLSENSEYDDAKNEQGRLESEISELEAKLRNSDIIQAAASTGKVMIGSTVTVRDVELDMEETYMIVGSTEADPDNNKISDESPLGAALLNKSAGATVQVHAPAGVIDFEILDVK
ncbi:MAG: transcription elongation factor GreA [Selenomonadaceae bacterium]|nr:transcription elongation factor GreA [Selenomonadaceae bacterium]MBQ3725653.1 transcription elongation factor GreA [Selenomonadaceae bacterium]MBQ9496300.1 transcription elongation factor GreA [Selenomonadaceae bacterium]MBR3498931.1 transcription elongation factor GreA [Selenomonadaceae bacterium]